MSNQTQPRYGLPTQQQHYVGGEEQNSHFDPTEQAFQPHFRAGDVHLNTPRNPLAEVLANLLGYSVEFLAKVNQHLYTNSSVIIIASGLAGAIHHLASPHSSFANAALEAGFPGSAAVATYVGLAFFIKTALIPIHEQYTGSQHQSDQRDGMSDRINDDIPSSDMCVGLSERVSSARSQPHSSTFQGTSRPDSSTRSQHLSAQRDGTPDQYPSSSQPSSRPSHETSRRERATDDKQRVKQLEQKKHLYNSYAVSYLTPMALAWVVSYATGIPVKFANATAYTVGTFGAMKLLGKGYDYALTQYQVHLEKKARASK